MSAQIASEPDRGRKAEAAHPCELGAALVAPAESPQDPPAQGFQLAIAPLLARAPSLVAQASARLARSWAKALALAWTAWEAQQALHPAQPLCLLDLAPGQGELAVALLRELALREDIRHLRWCYVAVTEGAQARALWAQPELEACRRKGRFDTVALAALRTGRLALPGARLELCGAANPVVALAFGGWSAMAPSLWCAHYGTLYQGRCRLTPEGAAEAAAETVAEALPADRAPTLDPLVPAGRLHSECVWDPVPALSHTPWPDLLAHYLQHFSSVTLTLPDAALEAVRDLHHFSQGRYALLVADQALSQDMQLRLGAGWPPQHWEPGVTRLPLNLHALRQQQLAWGAQVWDSQLQDGGWTVQLALCGSAQTGSRTLDAMALALSRGHPHDEAVYRAQLNGVQDLAQALVLLRELAHAPDALVALCDRVIPYAHGLDTAQHQAWVQALRLAMLGLHPRDADQALHLPLAELACALRQWGWARELLQAKGLQAARDRGLCMAHVEAHTGHTAEALARLSQPCWRHHPQGQALGLRLRERLRQWSELPWCAGQRPRHEELTLEPVGEEHQQAFMLNYRDSQIALLTGLPRFETASELQAWLSSLRTTPGAMDWAIMHRDHGFVGMVGSRRQGHTASFYFWLAPDRQGQGLGTRAAGLLFAHLRSLGVTQVVTSVLRQNQRSLACVRRLGFCELPLTALPPADVYLHFGLTLHAQAVDLAQLGQALCQLYRALGGTIVFESESPGTCRGAEATDATPRELTRP